MRGTTIFFIFFIKDLNKTHKKMIPQKFENFINAVIEIFLDKNRDRLGFLRKNLC